MNFIKLIWDFNGPVSNKTANHFNTHLQEFLVIEKMIDYKTCLEKFSDHHSIVFVTCLLYTSPSPRDKRQSRMPSSA